jgi:hypothetical protein
VSCFLLSLSTSGIFEVLAASFGKASLAGLRLDADGIFDARRRRL